MNIELTLTSRELQEIVTLSSKLTTWLEVILTNKGDHLLFCYKDHDIR